MAHIVKSRLPAKAVHEGVNAVVSQYTLNETASGSTTIVVASLPGGGQVLGGSVRINHAALNAGANAGAVRLYATIGGTEIGNIIPTSTISYVVSMPATGNLAALGERLTSSANLVLRLHDCAGTGTASTVFTVVCSYLAEEDPD